MILHKKIQQALELKQQRLGAPTNIFDLSLKDLESLGYKELKPKDEFQDGDLLDLAGQSLWGIILNTKSTRKAWKRSEVGSLRILRK